MTNLAANRAVYRSRRYVRLAVLCLVLAFCFVVASPVARTYAAPPKLAACPGGDFLGLPKWYKYLQCTSSPAPSGSAAPAVYTPDLSNINNVWLIVAAILELMLRLATLFAVGLVVWGGIQYVVSQGEPDKTGKARGTILNALIGLAICVVSAAAVAFVAGRFS